MWLPCLLLQTTLLIKNPINCFILKHVLYYQITYLSFSYISLYCFTLGVILLILHPSLIASKFIKSLISRPIIGFTCIKDKFLLIKVILSSQTDVTNAVQKQGIYYHVVKQLLSFSTSSQIYSYWRAYIVK